MKEPLTKTTRPILTRMRVVRLSDSNNRLKPAWILTSGKVIAMHTNKTTNKTQSDPETVLSMG